MGPSIRCHIEASLLDSYEYLEQVAAAVFPTSAAREEIANMFFATYGHSKKNVDNQVAWFIDHHIHGAGLGKSYGKPQWIRLISMALEILERLNTPGTGKPLEREVSEVIHDFKKFHGSTEKIKEFFRGDALVPNKYLYLYALCSAIYLDSLKGDKETVQRLLPHARKALGALMLIFDEIYGKEILWTTA